MDSKLKLFKEEDEDVYRKPVLKEIERKAMALQKLQKDKNNKDEPISTELPEYVKKLAD